MKFALTHSTPLAALAVLTLALTGCSSPGGGSSPGVEGDDLTVMVIQSLTGPAGVDQTAAKGAGAAAQSLNEAGGVNGHSITVISCDSASDPNKSTQCARDAVTKKAVAVVGSFDPVGASAALAVLEQAKIPYLGGTATTQAEFTSEVSFPLTSGAQGANFGMVPLAAQEGCTSVGTWGDSAADSGLSEQLTAGFEKAGMDVTYVALPLTTTDVSPMVTQVLAAKPDCIAFSASGLQATQLFAAVRAAGSDAKLLSASGSLLVPYLQTLGAAGEGIVATADAPLTTDPAVSEFAADMEKYEPDVVSNEITLQAWYAVQAFALAVEGMQEVSGPLLLERLAGMDDVRLPGLEPISFTSMPASDTLFPRMFNPAVQSVTAQGSLWVSSDDSWIDITEYLPVG